MDRSGVPYYKSGLGFDEVKTAFFVKCVFAEFLSTVLLIFVGIGAGISWEGHGTFSMQVGLAMGITISAIYDTFTHHSAALANPSLSLSLLVSGHITVMRFIFYLLAQTLGSIVAAGLFRLALPLDVDQLSVIKIQNGCSVWAAIGMEFLTSLMFLMVWQAVFDPFRMETKPLASSITGFGFTACHGMSHGYSGCGINPAKAIGPALMMLDFTNQWIYWVGPMSAGVVSGLLYKYVFMQRPAMEPNA